MNNRLQSPVDPITVAFGVGMVLVIIAAWYAWSKTPAGVQVAVAARDIPAYHMITGDDLTTDTLRTGAVTRQTITDTRQVLDLYTRAPIPQGGTFQTDQFAPITDTLSLRGTVAVAITTTGTSILLDQFRAGDRVNISTVPISGTNTSAALPLLPAVWVVDVQANGPNPTVVLAIPADNLSDYVARTRNASIVLTRAKGTAPVP